MNSAAKGISISEQIDAVARHEFDYIVRDLARAVRDDGSWSNVKDRKALFLI